MKATYIGHWHSFPVVRYTQCNAQVSLIVFLLS